MGESQDSDPAKPQGAGFVGRSGNNIWLVPIKKRRYLFQSSSLTQSPQKESEKPNDGQCASDQQAFPESTVSIQKLGNMSSKESKSVGCANYSGIDGRTLKTTEDVGGCGEDVSGVAMPTSAACADRQVTSTDIAGSLGVFTKSHNGAAKGSVVVSPNDIGKTLDGSKGSTASHDYRLHWDLNTPMDEWDHPLDDTLVDSEVKVESTVVDHLGIRKPGSIQNNDDSIPQSCIDGVNLSEVQLNLTHLACRTLQMKGEECSSRPSSCFQSDFLKDNCIPSSNHSEIFKDSISDMDSKVHMEVMKEVASVEHSFPGGPDEKILSLSDDNQKNVTASDPLDAANKDSTTVMRVEKSKKPETGSFQIPVSAETACEIDDTSTKVTEEAEETAALDDSKNKLPQIASPPFGPYPFDLAQQETEESCKVSGSNKAEIKLGDTTCQPTVSNSVDASCSVKGSDDIEKSSCKCVEEAKNGNIVDKLGDATTQHVGPHLDDGEKSSELKDVHTFHFPSTVAYMGKSSASVDHKRSLESALPVEAKDKSVENSSAVDLCGNQVICPANHSADAHLEDSLDLALPPDASYKAHCQVTTATGLEGESDSLLEDGELRESGYFSQYYGSGDGEAQHVQCSSDNRDGYEFTGVDDAFALVKVPVERERGRQSCQLDHLDSRDGHPKMDKSMEKNNAFCDEGSFLTACNIERKPVALNSVHMDNPEVIDMDVDDVMDSSIACDGPDKGEVDTSDDARDFPTQGACMKSLRSDLQSQTEGSFPSDRTDTDSASRSRRGYLNYYCHGDPMWTDADESPSKSRSLYMDGDGHISGHSWNRGLKSIVGPSEGDGSKIFRADDTPTKLHRQAGFTTSRVRYAPLIRRGSPTERDDDYGIGSSKQRDISSKSGLRCHYDNRNSCGISRGLREGYFRPSIYETGNPPGPMPDHFGKGERNLYPSYTRIDTCASRTRRRSRSRSRTRSPDNRPDVGMGRMRMQYRRSNNAEHARERRSPRRAYRPDQRGNTIASPGRLRSDDSVRPVILPIRSAGRAHDYEVDNYSRKPYFPRKHRRSRSRSISPEFRCEARMMSTRLPYQTSHMRERRSPVRMFCTNQRFDNVGSSSGRLRTDDDYSSHIMCPVRFQDTAQSLRGNEFDGNDYRRKPRTIFERIQPFRNYDI